MYPIFLEGFFYNDKKYNNCEYSNDNNGTLILLY